MNTLSHGHKALFNSSSRSNAAIFFNNTWRKQALFKSEGEKRSSHVSGQLKAIVSYSLLEKFRWLQ